MPTPRRHAIDSYDIRVLNILAESGQLSQRELAERVGLSLGMINLLLRRLTLTGYIKIVNLDRRKMRYLLTRKGLLEKTNRSYQYLLRTLVTYRQIYDRLEAFIKEQIQQGKDRFIVNGSGEVAEMVKFVLRNHEDRVRFDVAGPNNRRLTPPGAVVLHCDLNNQPIEGISVLEAVLKQSSYKPNVKGESHELV
ncbi:MAG: winged helix-turn-helix transcriptional regulator [Elusimicrobiota bacterium]|jgi:DNA-binding Lrp family transcriptional regulator